MVLNIFAVLDHKASAYAQPFFMPTKAQASRAFGDVSLDQKSDIARHPEDYSLYHLGVFHQDTGKIVSFDKPEVICKALDFIVQKVEA